MKEINPYLLFNGECAKAMKFYQKSLGGDLQMVPFSEAPMPETKHLTSLIMHARLQSGSAVLMASDATPEHTVKSGSNFSVSINCNSSQEVDKFFGALKENGKVTMAPADTFWGAYFAMLTDQFGINWMLNFDKKR